MPPSSLQHSLSRIRSKLGFRSPSRSSTKKPPPSKSPTLTKEEEETVGEEKVARSDDIKLKEKGELMDEKNLIGGSNVKEQEVTSARESQEQLKNGESKLEDLSDEIGKGKSKKARDKKVHDVNMRDREKLDAASTPFPTESGEEEIKMAMEGEHIEKEKPTSAPLPNESGEKEINGVRAVVEEEEQGHDYMAIKRKEDSKKMTTEGEKQDGDRRDGGKIERVGEEKDQVHDTKIKEKEDSTSSPFTVENGREGIKMTEEGEEQDGGRRDRGMEEPTTSAPLANGTAGEETTRVRGGEEQGRDGIFGQKYGSTSSSFRIENGKEEKKMTEKGEEQDGDKRERGKEESIAAPLPDETGGEEMKRMKGEESTSHLPSESGMEKMKMMSEGIDQDVDARNGEKEDLTPSLPDRSGWTAIKRMTKREEHAIDRTDKEKEDSASSPLLSESDRDATSSPPSLIPMSKSEKVPLGEQLSSSLPSAATIDQERMISETREGQTSDRSHQIKEDSISLPLIPVPESKAIDAGKKMPHAAVSTTGEEERSRSKSMVASERRTMPSSPPVSAPTSGEDLIGESNRMEHKSIRSKEAQEEEEYKKISKIIKEEITRAGERQAQGLLELEMLIKLGNGSITTSTLLAAIEETIHKEIEALKSTLLPTKEELKGQVEGGGMICRETHLKIKESDKKGRERDESSSRENSRLMSCPSSTPTTKEEDTKKSDVEGQSGEKTQVPRGRDGKGPKENEGREVVEEMRDGGDERNVASPSHMPKPMDEETTSLGKEQEKKGGTSNGLSSGKALGVLGVMAAITSIGTVVLTKRLESVRRRKYK